MAPGRVDFGVLRGTLGVFAICVLLSVMMVVASGFFGKQMASEYRATHARFRDASRKYLSVDDDARLIAEFYPAFGELSERGIIGPEHRLDWIEALRAAGTRVKIPELEYKLDSQAVVEPEPPLPLGAFNVYGSDMHLALGLLHEGDLVNLLDELDRTAKGLYTVSRCELLREERVKSTDPTRPKLHAECVLRWYTVDLRGERRLQP
jgi:hypothetical protein